MVHEFHRIPPTLMFEEDNAPVAFLPELKTYFGTDPFFGTIHHLPENLRGWMKLKDFHVETAAVKAELQYAAHFAFALRFDRPPGG
jgi:hypothetical protein